MATVHTPQSGLSGCHVANTVVVLGHTGLGLGSGLGTYGSGRWSGLAAYESDLGACGSGRGSGLGVYCSRRISAFVSLS